MRATIFICVAAFWCARSLLSFADPAYTDPVSAADWFAVVSFTVALFALAFALPMLAQLTGGGRLVYRASLIPAVGAAVAGFSNLLEDALQLGFAYWAFIGGSGVFALGIIVFALVVADARSDRRELFAIVPAATLIGWMLLEIGGGVIVAAAWLTVAAISLRSPEHSTTDAAAAGTHSG